jgi:hypothetical protein
MQIKINNNYYIYYNKCNKNIETNYIIQNNEIYKLYYNIINNNNNVYILL